MCGILLHYAPDQGTKQGLVDEYVEYGECPVTTDKKSKTSDIFEQIVPYIKARGPDYCSFRSLREHCTAWFSSVLSLRDPFTSQSVDIDGRYILQFNGELYNAEVQNNDTQFIVSKLLAPEADVYQIVQSLQGEFSYTIYDLKKHKFFFGRDNVGKRSLGYRLCRESGELYVSSVSGAIDGFVDCAAGAIYVYDPATKSLDHSFELTSPYTVSPAVDHELTGLDCAVTQLYDVLDLAVRKRVRSIHPIHIENSPIGILFSGGLDCTVIAALVCRQLQQCSMTRKVVELINVGFENPRTGIMPADTPDRKLASSSARFLKRQYPDIDIRLIEVDVPYEEYLQQRDTVIDLMYPKDTEMDLSIAIAFYFASRGAGKLRSSAGETVAYQRQAIVLFSGLGADELYGGYHKLANKSLAELQQELSRQINNIHDRNLNRDDKVIAINGVEVRYPFLDHDVIQFSTQELPISYKINKLALRKLASDKLALDGICDEPKRAIQFGTKSAKMTKDGNKHGTDRLK
ncbi:hypothetical protein HG536_0H00450 [Torulaspora globosa]|uniref:Asparagine synthase (glutamine-hydrolyzing) n=1 Tax=Torulaspora globosa TaxID=48254 RepID=A0A7G3ZMD4_9SACH|nr:uncharacterized protein HG536_0H00450 [Torulaspora globosa]QLL34670.1 hypothetical protein HG536_0H00450 [Torulaspora globosa]